MKWATSGTEACCRDVQPVGETQNPPCLRASLPENWTLSELGALLASTQEACLMPLLCASQTGLDRDDAWAPNDAYFMAPNDSFFLLACPASSWRRIWLVHRVTAMMGASAG